MHLPRDRNDASQATAMLNGHESKDKIVREPVVDIQACSAQHSPPTLPVFDISMLLVDEEMQSAEQDRLCREIAACLQQTGCLIVRDPRVGTEQSNSFLDMMERYFCQPKELKLPDVYPELHYQVSGSPSRVAKRYEDPAQLSCFVPRYLSWCHAVAEHADMHGGLHADWRCTACRWVQLQKVWKCQGVLWIPTACRPSSSSCLSTEPLSHRAQTPNGASSGA